MLSQILVASTYPLEVVQAYQFVQRNPTLTGQALMQAAQQKNWDPSVQALVIFPDVLKRLNDDVTWTMDLGNAFLAQEQDVMNAVQRMRQKAEQAGKLQSTPQMNVTNTTENGQPVVVIQPANPEVIYVPIYNPSWIWGPALWYPYPSWYWPAPWVIAPGYFIGFGVPINIGLYFGASWYGWGGWGWHCGWGQRHIIVNNGFIHEHNFNTARLPSVHGESVWTHNPEHRQGVPYPTPALRSEFRDNVRRTVAPRALPPTARTPAGQALERFGNREIPRSRPPAQNRGAFSGMDNGPAARTFSEHGYSSLGPARSAPRAAPPSARPAPAAPRSAAPPRGAAPRPAPAPSAPAGHGRGR